LDDVGRLAGRGGTDMEDAFSLFDHFSPGQAPPQRSVGAPSFKRELL
jgi:hypothetical protein